MNLQLHNAVVSRREDIFESPNEFFPERWLRDYTPKVHPYAVLPFSHGTRNCVGKRFAEQEIMLATIRVCSYFFTDICLDITCIFLKNKHIDHVIEVTVVYTFDCFYLDRHQ